MKILNALKNRMVKYTDDAVKLCIPGLDNQLKMYIHSGTDIHISQNIKERGIWEPNETHFISQLLLPGQTFIDVGANIGYFSLLASKLLGPTGRVFAFEPDSSNFHLLSQNCKLNHCDNVELTEAALSDENSEGTLYLNEENKGDHTIYPVGPGRNRREIQLCHGSDYIEEKGGAVHFIKVDTQGSEYHVIKGLERIIKTNMPGLLMLVELSPNSIKRAGATAKGLLDLLHSFDGHYYILDAQPGYLFSISHEHLANWVALTEMNEDSIGFINLVVAGHPLDGIDGIHLSDEPDRYENGLEQLLIGSISPWNGRQCNGRAMNELLYFASGWSFPEEWGIWSSGCQSRILFTLDSASCPIGKSLTLHITGRYFGDEEETGVYLNQHHLGDHNLINCQLTIDSELLLDKQVTLKLVHKNPVKPIEISESSDERELKFGLESMAWSTN